MFGLGCVAAFFFATVQPAAFAWGKKTKKKISADKQEKRYAAVAQKALNKARTLREKGKNDLALMELKKALEADPSMAEGYLELGDLYWELQIPEKALEILEPGVPLAEQQGFDLDTVGEAYCLLAQVHQAMGQTDKASGALARAAEILPDSALPRKILGDIQAARGKPEDAQKAYQEAVNLDPKNPDTWWALGQFGIDSKLPVLVQEAYQGLLTTDSLKATEFSQLMLNSGFLPAQEGSPAKPAPGTNPKSPVVKPKTPQAGSIKKDSVAPVSEQKPASVTSPKSEPEDQGEILPLPAKPQNEAQDPSKTPVTPIPTTKVEDPYAVESPEKDQ